MFFDGEYRSKPVVSLGGRSKLEQRSDLLQRAQREREKREAHRRSVASSLTIQKCWRGHRARRRLQGELRKLYDLSLPQMTKAAVADGQFLICTSRQLSYFYSGGDDNERLMQFASCCSRQRSALQKSLAQQPEIWCFRLQRIIVHNCQLLQALAAEGRSVSVPLRFLEVILQPTLWSFAKGPSLLSRLVNHLVRNGYFHSLVQVVEALVPAPAERSARPPSVLADSLLSLLRQPLVSCGHARDAVLQALAEDVLSYSSLPVVRLFLLPALSDCSDFTALCEAVASLCAERANFSQLPKEVKRRTYGLPSYVETTQTNFRTTAQTLPGRKEADAWLLYSLLCVLHEKCDGHATVPSSTVGCFLSALTHLLPSLAIKAKTESDDKDQDEADEDMWSSEDVAAAAAIPKYLQMHFVRGQCVRLLGERTIVSWLMSVLRSSQKPSDTVISGFAHVVQIMLYSLHHRVYKQRLLFSLALHPHYLSWLWETVSLAKHTATTGYTSPLLGLLIRSGYQLPDVDSRLGVDCLTALCSLLDYNLLSVHKEDFYSSAVGEGVCRRMPFILHQLVLMSGQLRQVAVAILTSEAYGAAALLADGLHVDLSIAERAMLASPAAARKSAPPVGAHEWQFLFKCISSLLHQLYERDSHQSFCPPNHWLTDSNLISLDMLQVSTFFPEEDENVACTTTAATRALTVLRHVPFIVPFHKRVQLFHSIVAHDRGRHQGELTQFNLGSMLDVRIRRDHIYEDAFSALSAEEDLKQRLFVQLINFHGLDEAGVDGGGPMREFLNQLLKIGFNPSYGFFKSTHSKLLYPSPEAHLLNADHLVHFYFLGRMLGKALYEKMLVELPFAGFFLSKLLGKTGAELSIHHLASLDPELYRNLLFLRDYDGDVSDLALDFTVSNNELGQRQIVELKPGGANIPVSAANCIEYIYLVADYRLNRQLAKECAAFRQGLASMIDLSWLRMFSADEVQVLISGAMVPVDITDLRKHTNYSGGYTAEHPVIVNFWRVVEGFLPEDRQKLLLFVTSCSRSPLLGFKELYPAFCIHNAGDVDRLPSASTCMNLLKLPPYSDLKTMDERLHYAIHSESGFELS